MMENVTREVEKRYSTTRTGRFLSPPDVVDRWNGPVTVRSGQSSSGIPRVSGPNQIATAPTRYANETAAAAAGNEPDSATSHPAISGPIAVALRAAFQQKPCPVALTRVGKSSGRYTAKVPKPPITKYPKISMNQSSVGRSFTNQNR